MCHLNLQDTRHQSSGQAQFLIDLQDEMTEALKIAVATLEGVQGHYIIIMRATSLKDTNLD